MTVGPVMGVVCMPVNYDIVHLWFGTRTISTGAQPGLGAPRDVNGLRFHELRPDPAYLDRDEHLFEWSFLIVARRFRCPAISRTFAIADMPS